MADYDVGVLGLTSPPAAAPKTTYRPAVRIRNNGLHDALASGYVRIYAAGLLVFESEVYSNTLVPGASGDASAVDYWTPEEEGTYYVQGYVSTPLDQVEANNNLHPVKVVVAGAPPEPPTPVEPHAAQHEEDGSDELSIDGLKGRAADPQPALAHVGNHQVGGSDEINVGSLSGELASPQTPKAHGNAYHSPQMATAQELTTHNNAASAHTAALNLEQTDNKGEPDGYAALDGAGHVPDDQLADVGSPPPNAGDALTFGSGWSQANPLPHAPNHEPDAIDSIFPAYPPQTGTYALVLDNDTKTMSWVWWPPP